MKKLTILAAMAVTVFVSGCKNEAEAPKDIKLETLDDKMSYILGHGLASQSKVTGFEVNAEALAMAIKDVQADAEPRFTEEEMMATQRAFQTRMREKAAERQAKLQEEAAKLAEANAAAGKAFLEENGKKEGVTTTESGLQYEVITAGEGEKPVAKDTVVAHYRGTTLDGKEFDSSYKKGEPATFPVGNLIPGWVEALQLMPAGSKWKLYIPGELAYGATGRKDHKGDWSIEPNALLVFELELLEINPSKEEPAAEPAEK